MSFDRDHMGVMAYESARLGAASGAVCFDLDGVLVDTEPIWERVRRRFAEEQGGAWTPSLQERMMGVQTRDWSIALSDAIAGRRTPDEIAAVVTDELANEYRTQPRAIPGAAEAVRRLARSRPLGLVSGSPLRLITMLLDELGISDCFRVAMSADEVDRGKPAPDPYLGLARRLEIPPSSCVAVEDSANGVRSAHAAGMKVIAIPRGNPPPNAVLGLAVAVLGDISELTDAVVDAAGVGVSKQ